LATPQIYEAPRPKGREGETVVTSTCGHNCGGRCVVNAHVANGRMLRVTTDARPWNPDHAPLRACARGVGQIERTYHPERLTHPMRRVGPRGSGQFERISWDEALDTVAAELLRVRATYGNAAILDGSRSGSTSLLHGRAAAQRFLNMFGGATQLWSNMSCEAEIFAVRATFGPAVHYKAAGREPTDYVNSKLILCWGWSPGDGTFGTGTMDYLKDAKRAGARIVTVDPRRTRTSRQIADEHVFIRPSTDAAALIAMAYVIVSEGLHDQAFLDRYVQGFDAATLPPGAPADACYSAYLTGEADGVPKTPEWAEAITGISADALRRLAIEFGQAKPAAIQCGYGPGRTAYGEQFHRAAQALAAITGNIGIPGGSSSTSNGATGYCGFKGLPAGANPVSSRVATGLLADFLAKGTAGGYPADIKLIYAAGGDIFNQASNAAKISESLDSVEFIVGQDNFLTPTTRHADIVLPATTPWERNDIHVPWAGAGHYAIYMKQAIQPYEECRNDMDIYADLARRVGIEGYSDKSEAEWLREIACGPVEDFEAFTENGVVRLPPPKDAVAFADEIRDPENHPFSTPSGRIEIYASSIADAPDPYGLGAIPPIPTWTGHDPTTSDHPLSYCSSKSRARTHSIHGNQDRLGRVDPDNFWIHPTDAAARGIADGDAALISSPYGRTRMTARVTEDIAVGVVSIKEGAWFEPGADGVDTSGCANALTRDATSPAGAMTYNSNAVQVTKL